MKTHNYLPTAVLTGVLLTVTPGLVLAQDHKVELGSSLVSALISVEEGDGGTIIGIPSAGFGFLNPGVYASFFLGPRVAVEPQIGLLLVTGGGSTEHILNFVGQVDYFVEGLDASSPYVFGSAGVISSSGSGPTPKSVGGGAGYRMPVGDRLVFRIDARYIHFTEDGGNLVGINFAIGGLLR